MIEAVFVFGLMNVLFEYVLLCMLRPRTRLRVLGNPDSQKLLHVGFLLINLIVHWGTLVGTMSGIGAFIASIVTVAIARRVFGWIEGSSYRVGWIKYSKEELK